MAKTPDGKDKGLEPRSESKDEGRRLKDETRSPSSFNLQPSSLSPLMAFGGLLLEQLEKLTAAVAARTATGIEPVSLTSEPNCAAIRLPDGSVIPLAHIYLYREVTTGVEIVSAARTCEVTFRLGSGERERALAVLDELFQPRRLSHG